MLNDDFQNERKSLSGELGDMQFLQNDEPKKLSVV